MNEWSIKRAMLVSGIAICSVFSPGFASADDNSATPKPAGLTIAENAKWSFRLPQEERVFYRGSSNLDRAGIGSDAVLYPAPNAAGFFAALITHGILVEARKKSQQEKIQASADWVLVPYKAILEGFSHRDLLQRVLNKANLAGKASIVEGAVLPGAEVLVEISPVFSMTQDRKAIVLENEIVILPPGAKLETAYRNIIRVVSKTREEEDPTSFWISNNGDELKNESASLVAESFEIALRDATANKGKDEGEIPYRTIRYREGSAEKIERAQVISNGCDRLLIRTLRGALMSVPTSRSAAALASAEPCGTALSGKK